MPAYPDLLPSIWPEGGPRPEVDYHANQLIGLSAWEAMFAAPAWLSPITETLETSEISAQVTQNLGWLSMAGNIELSSETPNSAGAYQPYGVADALFGSPAVGPDVDGPGRGPLTMQDIEMTSGTIFGTAANVAPISQSPSSDTLENGWQASDFEAFGPGALPGDFESGSGMDGFGDD